MRRIQIHRICMFWASWIQIHILFEQILIRLRILQSNSKKLRKSLIFTVLGLLYEVLSLKNDVKPFKRNKQKFRETKIIFCWHLEGYWRKEQDLEPDPLVKGTDPRIWIHTKCHGSGTRVTVGLCKSWKSNWKLSSLDFLVTGLFYRQVIYMCAKFIFCILVFAYGSPVHE